MCSFVYFCIPLSEPLKCLPSLPSFSTKFTASQNSPSPTKLDSAGDIAENEMSYILDRNLGLSLNDADLNIVAEEEGASLNSDAEEEDLSKLLPTDLNEFFGGKPVFAWQKPDLPRTSTTPHVLRLTQVISDLLLWICRLVG